MYRSGTLNRTWIENFSGGVTTSHGINQVFKEHNGGLRRIVWMIFFCGSFYVLFFFIIDAIRTYIDAETSTSLSTYTHGGLLPMVTLCNLRQSEAPSSPYRTTSVADGIAPPSPSY